MIIQKTFKETHHEYLFRTFSSKMMIIIKRQRREKKSIKFLVFFYFLPITNCLICSIRYAINIK